MTPTAVAQPNAIQDFLNHLAPPAADARDLLVRRLLPVVGHAIAKLDIKSATDREDARQAGMLRTLSCIERFDPQAGMSLSTYVYGSAQKAARSSRLDLPHLHIWGVTRPSPGVGGRCQVFSATRWRAPPTTRHCSEDFPLYGGAFAPASSARLVRRRRRVFGSRPAARRRAFSACRDSNASTRARLRTTSAAARNRLGVTRPMTRHQPFSTSTVAGSLIRLFERSTALRLA